MKLMVKRLQLDKIFTVEQAAKILKYDPSHIRRLLIEKKLEGMKIGRDWVVLKLDYKRKRKPKGGQSNA
jgi:excisionase family DNA binding protein